MSKNPHDHPPRSLDSVYSYNTTGRLNQTLKPLKEKFLIQGLKQKDKAVFDFVFTYYYSGLCAFGVKFIADAHVVEDIVQECFFRLWVESEKLEIKTSLKSYLFAVVRNRCLDYLKRQKVRDAYSRDIFLTAGNGEYSVYNDLYAETELKEIIREGLNKLPPRCREIFMLNRFKGKSNAEIAEDLNISKRTVELQISNALKVLRKELKEYLPLWLI